LKLHK